LKNAAAGGAVGSGALHRHNCSKDYCHPRSEEDFGGQPKTYNVYLCKFGTIHVCSEESCKLYGSTPTQTCPVSGQQMSSIVSTYAKDDSRTWYNKGTETEGATTGSAGRKKKRASIFNNVLQSESSVRDMAETIVTKLLYSHARVEHNEIAIKKYTQESTIAMNTYCVARKTKLNQMGYLTDLYRIRAFYLSQYIPLKEMELDMNVVKYYVEIIWQVWKICVKYHVHPDQRIYNQNGNEIKNRLSVDVVALGVLYSLRQGISVEGLPVLPKDDFLEHLPLVNNYAVFGIDKKKVTKGLNTILATYTNATNLGVDQKELLLDLRPAVSNGVGFSNKL
jgi:hypothetical protein